MAAASSSETLVSYYITAGRHNLETNTLIFIVMKTSNLA
jgi:hypothetical protein